MAKKGKGTGAPRSTRPRKKKPAKPPRRRRALAKKKASLARPSKKKATGPTRRRRSPATTKKKPLDLHKLTRAGAARILDVPIEQIERDLREGAPTSARGRIDLVRYTSWLLWRIAEGD